MAQTDAEVERETEKLRYLRERVLAEQDAKLRKVRSKERPLVRQIFAMFEAEDGGIQDGVLSKDEYKHYLEGIGTWGSGPYTDEAWAGSDEAWEADCELTECGPSDGITWKAFEGILYGKYRLGKALADLERCKEYEQRLWGA